MSSPSDPPYAPLESLTCPLCLQLIATAAETLCGHTYCDYCLSEYFLALPDCYVCGAKIRQTRTSPNKRFDQLVEQVVGFFGGEIREEFTARKERNKKYNQDRIVEEPASGMFVDIRDEDYVWHKGLITRAFYRVSEQTRRKFIEAIVMETSKKEEFAKGSPRIAPQGFYTNRTDIPKPEYESQGRPKKRVKRSRVQAND